MKITAFILSIFLCLWISNVSAQNMGIQEVYMSPPNPTDQDIITLYTDLTIPTSGCWKTGQTTTVNPFYIYNKSNYCRGNYQAVCSTIDTVTLQPLEAGNYIYHYVVDLASYLDECEVYYPYDSIGVIFTILNSSAITDNLDNKFKIYLHYSKFENSLDIKIDKYIGEYTIYINSVEGKGIKLIKSKNLEQKVDLDLKSGIYLVTIVGNKIFETKKIFVSN